MSELQKGDHVYVTGVGPGDQQYRGRWGTVLEASTAPHGFARVCLNGGESVLLHPESLVEDITGNI